jgi:hypothetical protein
MQLIKKQVLILSSVRGWYECVDEAFFGVSQRNFIATSYKLKQGISRYAIYDQTYSRIYNTTSKLYMSNTASTTTFQTKTSIHQPVKIVLAFYFLLTKVLTLIFSCYLLLLVTIYNPCTFIIVWWKECLYNLAEITTSALVRYIKSLR